MLSVKVDSGSLHLKGSWWQNKRQEKDTKQQNTFALFSTLSEEQHRIKHVTLLRVWRRFFSCSGWMVGWMNWAASVLSSSVFNPEAGTEFWSSSTPHPSPASSIITKYNMNNKTLSAADTSSHHNIWLCGTFVLLTNYCTTGDDDDASENNETTGSDIFIRLHVTWSKHDDDETVAHKHAQCLWREIILKISSTQTTDTGEAKPKLIKW